jgi:PAS domain S-box-containing protein
VRATGESRDLVVTYVHVPPDAVAAHTRDVTERRRMEADLRSSHDALVHTRERHETAQRIGHLGHWDWDVDRDELFWSNELYRIFGVEPSVQISFEAFMGCVHPQDRDRVQSAVERALARGGPYSFEHRVLRTDGSIRNVLEQGEVKRHADMPRSMVGTVLDITELKAAERAVRARETEMTTVMEGNPDGICVIVDGRINVCNGSLATLVGCSKDALTGRRLHDLMVPGDRDRARERGRTVFEGGASQPAEYTLIRSDGSRVPVEIYSAVFDFRGERALICTLRDIEKRKSAARELAESRDALRALTQHLEGVREQERAQVARDLHDELGSVLTALKIDLGEASMGDTKRMSKLLDQAIEVGRRVTARLRPGILDDLGLAAAAEWLGSDLEWRTGIRCKVVLPEVEPDLPEPVATAMFRILQEALTNVIRHASAQCVEVALESDSESVSLSVSDNGVGFDPPARGEGFGLLGMRERVRAFDGVFDVDSVPGEGTRIFPSLPSSAPVKVVPFNPESGLPASSNSDPRLWIVPNTEDWASSLRICIVSNVPILTRSNDPSAVASVL